MQYPADSIPSREVRDDAELDLTHVKREAGERSRDTNKHGDGAMSPEPLPQDTTDPV